MCNFLNSVNKPGNELKRWVLGLSVMMRQTVGAKHFWQSVGRLKLFGQGVCLVYLLWVKLWQMFFYELSSKLLIIFQGLDLLSRSLQHFHKFCSNGISRYHHFVDVDDIFGFIELCLQLFSVIDLPLEFGHLLLHQLLEPVVVFEELKVRQQLWLGCFRELLHVLTKIM